MVLKGIPEKHNRTNEAVAIFKEMLFSKLPVFKMYKEFLKN